MHNVSFSGKENQQSQTWDLVNTMLLPMARNDALASGHTVINAIIVILYSRNRETDCRSLFLELHTA